MGVFATRSPFRPNAIGLSSVKLDRMELKTEEGPVIYVKGADLMDNTPILDIKPYLAYVDSHPEAKQGFRGEGGQRQLEVKFPEAVKAKGEKLIDSAAGDNQLAGLMGVLANDPRPTYQEDPQRIYGMEFGGIEVKFQVKEKQLTVTAVEKI